MPALNPLTLFHPQLCPFKELHENRHKLSLVSLVKKQGKPSVALIHYFYSRKTCSAGFLGTQHGASQAFELLHVCPGRVCAPGQKPAATIPVPVARHPWSFQQLESSSVGAKNTKGAGLIPGLSDPSGTFPTGNILW